MMKDAIRCCISCILPCGALDVIRVVHPTGRVEEITGPAVTADHFMQAYPNHVVKKPAAPPLASDGVGRDVGSVPRKAIVLPPDAKLQRGKIYFLVRVSSPPEKPQEADAGATAAATAPTRQRRRKKKMMKEFAEEMKINGGEEAAATHSGRLPICRVLDERYLSEILSEKAATQGDRRRGRVGIWRPHLESISEVSGDL